LALLGGVELLVDDWGLDVVYSGSQKSLMNEALRLVVEETLQVRWDRHRDAAHHLYSRLEAAGLELVVAAKHCNLAHSVFALR